MAGRGFPFQTAEANRPVGFRPNPMSSPKKPAHISDEQIFEKKITYVAMRSVASQTEIEGKELDKIKKEGERIEKNYKSLLTCVTNSFESLMDNLKVFSITYSL